MLSRLAAFAAAAAVAAAASTAPAEGVGHRAVVELFTSQSCYSCPPAERYLGELAERDDVLALEFHVDYWDSLVYGSAGKWRDVFSSPAHTARQVAYNRRIRGRGNVYTPQMVIDGRAEAVGTDREGVQSAIETSGTHGDGTVGVRPVIDGDAGVRVALSGDAPPGDVWLVRFVRKRLTRVRAGENKGKDLVNHNVVTEMRRIGRWEGVPGSIAVPDFSLGEGEGCAVLVQDRRPGPVAGAALCPDRTS